MSATGKDHARVNLDIWNDDDWLDLSPAAQHLYFVLWTSPSLSYCGVGDWNPKKIAQRSKKWTVEAVERAAAELNRELFALFDPGTDEFLLRSWIKHDGLWRMPNMAVSMANARAAVASRTLRGVIVFEVAKLRSSHPESKGWERDAVIKMLQQKAIDPALLTPTLTPSLTPELTPTLTPHLGVNPNPPVNPPPNPGPTPSPAPISIYNSGYVSREPHQTSAHDPSNPPPKTCPEHPDGTTRACGACGIARKERESWDAEQTRLAAERRRAERQAIAAATAAEIELCDLCDDDGYVGVRVCDHDPEAAERNARGSAMVREALAAKDGAA